MTELRDKVVEAMAQALRTFYQLDEIPTDQQTSGWAAEAALDTALDVLGEHAEDWMADGFWHVDELLAVLRAGKGSDE